MSLTSNKLNILARISDERIAIPPPATAEKKFGRKFKQMFAMKWPNRLDGREIRVYLKDSEIKFSSRFGNDFLMVFKFNNDIKLIEIKNDTVTALIPIVGVKISKLNISVSEPMM